MRHCKTCGNTGHNSRTCGRVEKVSDSTPQPENQTQEAVQFLDGVPTLAQYAEPRRGLWFVNIARKRVAGKILYSKSDNKTFVYQDGYSAHIECDTEKAKAAGYCYVDLEPYMLHWSINK
jgi:hypothetical protein